MKKTYAAPTVSSNGTVVRETQVPISSGPESAGKEPLTAGRVGFYL